jgi:hypothetical protein
VGRHRLRIWTLALYVVLVVGWTYGVLNDGTLSEHVGFGAEVAGAFVLYAAFGAGLASRWAVLLPLVTFLLELPAGDTGSLGRRDLGSVRRALLPSVRPRRRGSGRVDGEVRRAPASHTRLDGLLAHPTLRLGA